MSFEVVPVVHLEEGLLPELGGESVDSALTRLARRFGRVALVDVSGVRRNQPQLEAVQAASRRRAVWIDAGSRFATDAMDLFIAGAESVTLRWNTLDSGKELEEAAELCEPSTLFLGLEHPGGRFLENRRDVRPLAAVARMAEELGMGVVHVVGEAQEHLVRGLPASEAPRFVMGPFWGWQERLEELGFAGMLVPAGDIPEESP